MRNFAFNQLLTYYSELGFFFIGNEENLIKDYNCEPSHVITRCLIENINIDL